MNSKISMVKSLAVAVALAAGVSGSALADDSSLNPFTGDSFASFNGGYDRRQSANATFNKASSEWRQSNPQGLSERVLQSYSAWGMAWKPQPVFTIAPEDPTFRQSHPNGLTERELQALSSGGPAWHSSPRSTPSAQATRKYGLFTDRAAE